MPTRSKKRWTEEEKNYLAFMWGVYSIDAIAFRLNRSDTSVYKKARRLGLGPRYRGTLSLNELARRAGCERKTVLNLMHRLGIRARRLQGATEQTRKSRNRRFMLQFEDAMLILDEYRRILESDKSRVERRYWGEWGRGAAEQCVVCGTTDTPRMSKGMCRSCYEKYLRRRKRSRHDSV